RDERADAWHHARPVPDGAADSPSMPRRRLIHNAGIYLGLDRAGVGYGLRLALSALLAFSVASLLQVENAYWAAMPVWVVTQNVRGLLIERAVFRVVGT